MPAPTIYELYKFETHIISASKAILNNAGITASYAQQDNSNLPSPRVELQSIFGSPTGHVHISGSTAKYDSWNATMNVLVVTDRTNNPTFHYDFTSKIISLLGEYSNYNSGSNLPYHSVVKADYNGSTPSVETDDNKDVSALSFVLSVWVKPSAWPT